MLMYQCWIPEHGAQQRHLLRIKKAMCLLHGRMRDLHHSVSYTHLDVYKRQSSDKAGNDTTPETGNADTLKADSGSAE